MFTLPTEIFLASFFSVFGKQNLNPMNIVANTVLTVQVLQLYANNINFIWLQQSIQRFIMTPEY
jgi:hypothetical protein